MRMQMKMRSLVLFGRGKKRKKENGPGMSFFFCWKVRENHLREQKTRNCLLHAAASEERPVSGKSPMEDTFGGGSPDNLVFIC